MQVLPFSESFILAIVGSIFGAIAGCLMCVLKSRCTNIKCCGCECQRDVLPPDLVVENNLQQNYRDEDS